MTRSGRSFLAQLVESSKRMQDLIRDILSFSRIGKEVSTLEVSCDEVLDRVLYNLTSALDESRVEAAAPGGDWLAHQRRIAREPGALRGRGRLPAERQLGRAR